MSDPVDYTSPTTSELMAACGTSAIEWARAFAQHHPNGGDVTTMVHWFASAMLATLLARNLDGPTTTEGRAP